MKNINYLSIILISILAVSCSKVSDTVKKSGLGSRTLNYQSDEKVDSLIIPPELTSPNSQGLFSEIVEVNNDVSIIKKVQNVEVMRDKYRRWLLVDLPPREVWKLSKDFFRSYGFKIEKENQNIGLLETDYLQIDTDVPDQSLGVIRSMLSKALNTKYGLPIADKYRIRLESVDNLNKTEVYLTLASIEEVVQGDVRVWQHRMKDVELETEMLLTLMVFLGSERSSAIDSIESTENKDQSLISVIESSNGFANLSLPFDKKQSWNYIGWALDELDIDVEDRDLIDGSFYINISQNNGFLSRLFSTSSDSKTYKLLISQNDELYSQVIFVDLSEEVNQRDIEFSFALFENIAAKF